jgi:hypothetical protein
MIFHGVLQMSVRQAVASVGLLFVAACDSTGPVPIGPDTYMLSKPGGFFTFSGGSVKADIYREANAFCAQQGKAFMPVTARAINSGPGTPAEAEIEFRCLSQNDPGLQRPTPTPDMTIKVN